MATVLFDWGTQTHATTDAVLGWIRNPALLKLEKAHANEVSAQWRLTFASEDPEQSGSETVAFTAITSLYEPAHDLLYRELHDRQQADRYRFTCEEDPRDMI